MCRGRLLIDDRSNNRSLTVAARKRTESTELRPSGNGKSKTILGSLEDLTSRITKVAKTGTRILPNPYSRDWP